MRALIARSVCGSTLGAAGDRVDLVGERELERVGDLRAALGEHPLVDGDRVLHRLRVGAAERFAAFGAGRLGRPVDRERHDVTQRATSPCVANHTCPRSLASL